jgi:hypothetical protein
MQQVQSPRQEHFLLMLSVTYKTYLQSQTSARLKNRRVIVSDLHNRIHYDVMFIVYSLSSDPSRLHTKGYKNCPENDVLIRANDLGLCV